ncbi:hypothetical protein [Flavobacterium terrisoli]|uniref:hypothetical protein n=1 Tax=Flavobacterium terrisoli TaxID=3242195 RepID=UPI002543AC17|nr:hypothetical protein [Flavobacterium buctense]
MKKNYFISLFILIVIFIVACSESNSDEYVPVSPVSVNLAQVPYLKLSDYKFFEGEMKEQIPALNVIPFAPSSSLFSDYAHKKRFVWMPSGSKATFVADNKVLELPVGSALIKTFYYDNVQPENVTRIIETRVMIRKATGWIFANYVWNAEQTEALLDLAGSYTPVTFKDDNNNTRSVDYRIPSEVQCMVCHKNNEVIDNDVVITYMPIGIKPQNLNYNYNYGSVSKNQLTKWVEQNYLDANFTYPTAENTTINYSDTSKPLELRARSYVDINCAHCHQHNRHCDYRPMRFAFSESGAVNGHTNMGVCVPTADMQEFPSAYNTIVKPGSTERSMMYYRINTTNEAYRMPLHGRTLIHDEGVALMGEWINSLTTCP